MTPSTNNSFHRLKDQIESTLLASRKLVISTAIDMELAEKTMKYIWYLEALDKKAPVYVIINSPGGSIDAGFAIWDQLKIASFPITTIVTGLAASMGSVLSLAAPKGKRLATPMSRFMIHQPALGGVVEGQATDLEIQAREILKTKERIVQLYCDATGKKKDQIEKAIDRDMWMTATEAKEFGLIDEIITAFPDQK
jgi:ATP-dependent Clp protease protease subunit